MISHERHCSVGCNMEHLPLGAACKCFSFGMRHPAISNKSTVTSNISQFSIKSEILGASGSLSLYFTNRPGNLSLW